MIDDDKDILLTFDDPVESFVSVLDALMRGVMVGFSLETEFIETLPPIRYEIPVAWVKTSEGVVTVEDSREGRVDLLRRLLTGFYFTGEPLRFCTSGGSPGLDGLAGGILRIADILRFAVGRSLKSAECRQILLALVEIRSSCPRRSAVMIVSPLY